MAQENLSEDEVLGKAYDAKLMKRLLGFIEPYKKYVIFAIVLNIFVAILSAIGPMLTKIAVDDYISKSNYDGNISDETAKKCFESLKKIVNLYKEKCA